MGKSFEILGEAFKTRFVVTAEFCYARCMAPTCFRAPLTELLKDWMAIIGIGLEAGKGTARQRGKMYIV